MNKFVFSGDASSDVVVSLLHVLFGINEKVHSDIEFPSPFTRIHWNIGNPGGLGLFHVDVVRERQDDSGQWKGSASMRLVFKFDCSRGRGAFYEITHHGGRYTIEEITEKVCLLGKKTEPIPSTT